MTYYIKYPTQQTDPPRPPWETLPTMYDLPSENPEEPGLPDEFHDFQPQLLSATLRLKEYAADKIFTATDMNLYYDVHHQLWYKRPDWFLVLGVPRLYKGTDLRLSYVIWQEGISPFVVVELLSPGTEKEDLGMLPDLKEPDLRAPDRLGDRPPKKWQVYEQILRIPYYVVFDRYTDRFRVFHLTSGRYQELDLSNNRFWFPDLNLGLGVWQGIYEGCERLWLRWFDENDEWIPTPEERAEAAENALVHEQQQTLNERQRADRLAEKLRALGIDPESE
ncbi:Uma2 family endonuclease [Oscillatoria sp. CS-180]|uniref:Uma2 family endonuclease n=1 Tax=Oscillatoria sp. CS-180 TaxID=3021720 RepID=UPI0023308A58|nr:Uma2 family endonuclease [Oscillatoria sp. CS-180]MDB9528845.1 Uma2 family endonuclease [Oscillatoria sp. CS-180]